ncbi:DNA polymerase III subunit delta' [Halanaerobaculum tunisiense]
MSFNQVVGQELAVSILQNSLQQDRLSHAYLFSGVTGVGKNRVAVAFAKAINCKEQKQDACGECISCRKVDSGNHPDIKELHPDGKSIKIAQIRSFQQEIVYKPYESKKKVYIIHQAEQMTAEAASSLLKTLEEPPEHGIIILLTNNVDHLLPTVISRCQLVRFNRVANRLVANKLEQDYQLPEQKRELVTSLAAGRMKKAINLVEDEAGLAKREEIMELVTSLTDIDRLEIFKLVEKMLTYQDSIAEVLNSILTWYRDILLCKLEETAKVINVDYLPQLQAEAIELTLDQVEEIIELVETTKNKIRQANVNLQLSLEVLLLKLRRCQVCK